MLILFEFESLRYSENVGAFVFQIVPPRRPTDNLILSQQPLMCAVVMNDTVVRKLTVEPLSGPMQMMTVHGKHSVHG